MAGIQWSGGKCHGNSEAKAVLRHNDKNERMIRNHSNPDIDTELTHLNFSFFGKSYYQKVKDYDCLMDTVKCKRKSSGKNATVTLQDLVIYCPEDMMDEKTGEYDYERICEWFMCVGDLLKKKYGKCFLDMDLHFDECHMYVEPKSKKLVWSRVHAHAALIPGVPEVDENGEPTGEFVLNAKKFSTRGNIVELNNMVHAMTLEKFAMPYMNGSKTKGRASVEEKKRESARTLMEMEELLKKREADLRRREKECQELILLGRRVKAEQISSSVEGQKQDDSFSGRKLPRINF